jgi:hypothetical protein
MIAPLALAIEAPAPALPCSTYQVGMRVIAAPSEVAPVEIASPALFRLSPPPRKAD